MILVSDSTRYAVFQGDVRDVPMFLGSNGIRPNLVIADPPYGDITKESWDVANVDMWIQLMQDLGHVLDPGVPVYWWGGIGKPNQRYLFDFILRCEAETNWRMRDMICWKKKRGYGKQGDYLFTREECAIFTLGGEPYAKFHKPYLDVERGYEGYNDKYPALSKFKRRSNVWDETEKMRDKLHPCHKVSTVCEIPIKAHTDRGDIVLELFAGCGEASVQAAILGRVPIAVEAEEEYATLIHDRLGTT